MQKINDKLYNWASIIEPNTLEQARVTSTMPFIYPHVALMPDAHLGKGSTVGSVIPTMKAIMPAAVGVDIGCGLCCSKTQFKKSDLVGKSLATLRHSIERSIPLSAGGYNTSITESALRRVHELGDLAGDRLDFYNSLTKTPWTFQLGSLGSGNHFIELSLDEAENIWLLLHSGSRGIGNKIATHHIDMAKRLNDLWLINLPNPDLAYLPEGTPEFDDYIRDLNWAQHFALLNRHEMMDRIVKDFEHWIGAEVVEQERIQCHHNFTTKRQVFGKPVWLSRKGAIDATKGKMGVIPGSMSTATYIIEGKGDEMSMSSSPHGAGRKFSRGMARKTFTMEQLRESMKDIEHRDSEEFLDEIAGAYKPIDQVMDDSKDLVEIKHTLHQLVNCKGD